MSDPEDHEIMDMEMENDNDFSSSESDFMDNEGASSSLTEKKSLTFFVFV